MGSLGFAHDRSCSSRSSAPTLILRRFSKPASLPVADGLTDLLAPASCALGTGPLGAGSESVAVRPRAALTAAFGVGAPRCCPTSPSGGARARPAATTARACHFVAETRRENLARWNCQTYCGVCSPGNQEIDLGHYKRLRVSLRFPTSHLYNPPFKSLTGAATPRPPARPAPPQPPTRRSATSTVRDRGHAWPARRGARSACCSTAIVLTTRKSEGSQRRSGAHSESGLLRAQPPIQPPKDARDARTFDGTAPRRARPKTEAKTARSRFSRFAFGPTWAWT